MNYDPIGDALLAGGLLGFVVGGLVAALLIRLTGLAKGGG